MATYSVSELFDKLCDLCNDGYEYVAISQSDDDENHFLSFYGIDDDYSTTDYETVDECIIPENYDVEDHFKETVDPDSFFREQIFTYNEMFIIKHAIDSALEYYKKIESDPVNKSNLATIKKSSVDCRNLQAKFAKLFKTKII